MNLNFDGDGRISVDVKTLLKSPRVQAQVQAVRELARCPVFQSCHAANGCLGYCAPKMGKI